MKHHTTIWIRNLLAIAALAFVGSAQADLLDLQKNDAPDIFVAGTSTYTQDGVTGSYTFAGTAENITLYDPEGVPGGDSFCFDLTADLDRCFIFDGPGSFTFGSWSMSASIDVATGDLLSGSFTITGYIDSLASLGIVSGVLLTGTVLDFGYAEDASGSLEFLLEVTGGALAPLYYGGAVGILIGNSGFPGGLAGLAQNWSGGSTQGDLARVMPLPGTLALLVGALFFMSIGAPRLKRREVATATS